MATVTPLGPREEQNLERTMRQLYGSGFEYEHPLAAAKRAGLKEVLYEDLETMRDAGMRLEPYYVRLVSTNGEVTATSATKVERWIAAGMTPVDELEVT